MDAALIQQKARALLDAETEAKRLEAEKVRLAIAAEVAEKERLEREARVIAAAERQQALLRAERIEAEAKAAETRAAEQAALDAELTRLRARTPLEILQEEMTEMKRQMAMLQNAEPLHLRTDGELDMRFKSSREELASARAEIVALKEQVRVLNKKMSGEIVIRNKKTNEVAGIGTTSWYMGGGMSGTCPALVPYGTITENSIWTLESV